jgi:SAM-dependent methyltransferase
MAPFTRTIVITAALHLFLTLFLWGLSLAYILTEAPGPQDDTTVWIVALAFMLIGVPLLITIVRRLPKWAAAVESWTGACAEEIEAATDEASHRKLQTAVTVIAGLTLFLELVLIRWESGFFPIFAMYKNFTLLACFCGLGLGYAMAKTRPLLLSLSLPALLLLLLAFAALRYGWMPGGITGQLLYVTPVHEETSMFGAVNANIDALTYFLYSLPVYILLIETFLLNTLVLLPLGQFCGYLMQRLPALEAYGWNLAGSIAGTALLFLFSWLWAGPVVWFSLAALLLAFYLMASQRARIVSFLCLMGCVAITAWPFDPLTHNIYSPYQLLQQGTQSNGLPVILASGTYYQKIYDLGFNNASRDKQKSLSDVVGYYEFPFRTMKPSGNVAIVGSGSGNDVAAALRCGASSVDAVEIDPAILGIGQESHPERPYESSRVHAINNDARNFFRTTEHMYNAIVYGVLDSHIVTSYGANLRVDSFVYTREGLQAAFDHVKPGGLLSVAFALPNPIMGEKVFRILKELPGAGSPIAVLTGYDSHNTTTFMVRKGGSPDLPKDFMAAHGLTDITADYAATTAQKLDLPTDDWPFFYMDAKMYPRTYVIALALILALAFALVRNFFGKQKWQASILPFFFLGSGFMLVETKAITEFGLLFGNTWQVVGVTIISILIMAYFANWLTERKPHIATTPVFISLLAVIGIGFAIAAGGNLATATALEKLLIVGLLSSPLFFSGLIFSNLLKRTNDIGSAMAYNLMGAMLGGALEYNAMQFGFSSLYLIAFALYALAWGTTEFKARY